MYKLSVKFVYWNVLTSNFSHEFKSPSVDADKDTVKMC